MTLLSMNSLLVLTLHRNECALYVRVQWEHFGKKLCGLGRDFSLHQGQACIRLGRFFGGLGVGEGAGYSISINSYTKLTSIYFKRIVHTAECKILISLA